MHVKPFTVLTEAVRRTPFRSTNGSTFDLAGPFEGTVGATRLPRLTIRQRRSNINTTHSRCVGPVFEAEQLLRQTGYDRTIGRSYRRRDGCGTASRLRRSMSSSGSSSQRPGVSPPPPFAPVHSPQTDEEQTA